MNPKVKTVLFVLTFIPYAVVILSGILGAVFGVNFFFTKADKLGGFILGALVSLCYMIIFPIIPVCAVFQLLCLLRKNVPFIKNIGAKEFDIACAVICAAVFITLLIRGYSKKFRQKTKARHISERADRKMNNIKIERTKPMSAELLPVITVMLLASLFTVCVAIIWLTVRGSRSNVTFSFVGCMFSQLLWIISQLMIIMAESGKQLLISYAVGNLGISFLGSCWLLFAVSYMDRELSKLLVSGTLTFSSLIFLCAATNPLHGLYYTEFSMERVVHGPVFYIMQVYTYLVMLIGIVLVCKKCFEIKERSRGQAVLLTLGTAVPLIINLLTLADVISLDFALTPISFVFSGILVLLATYRYGFLNVNDVAFEDAFNSIEEGVVIFNRRGRITYLSSAARRQLNISEKTELTSLIGYISELSGKDIAENFDYAEIENNGTVYGIRHYHCCNDKGVSVAQLLIVSDISRYYQLIEKTDELALARQKLALEQERNRIAQEVHDTAGHTFTIISSLAKLSQSRIANIKSCAETEELLEFAEKTESLARGGLTQLRCSINDLREDSFMTTVTAAVRTVTNAVRDINVQVCVQGTEDESYSFCVQNIYSSFRELITNSVRYSGADRIDVIIKFLGTSIELYVFDNGRGCAEITAHDGLRGITERTEALDGSAVFRSGEGIGFTAIIKIPVKG